jgi:hypothetical protein
MYVCFKFVLNSINCNPRLMITCSLSGCLCSAILCSCYLYDLQLTMWYLPSDNLTVFCVHSYSYRILCSVLFVNYGTRFIHAYCSDYFRFNGFISYSDNVFLSKINLEDPADPGSLCTSQSVGNHCWYLGMAAVVPTLQLLNK